MASRIMHLALAAKLAELNPCLNRNRFYYGSVMPDAGPILETHFLKNIADGTKRVHDLSGFRKIYGERMIGDDLYLGYYLHLAEDQIFRQYVFEIVRFDPVPEGNIAGLHHDYELLNRYVIEKYHVPDNVSIPAGIESEEICGISSFRHEAFMADLREDFTRRPQGETRFFNEEMTDRYIAEAAEICGREIRAVFSGGGYMDEAAYAWNRHRR